MKIMKELGHERDSDKLVAGHQMSLSICGEETRCDSQDNTNICLIHQKTGIVLLVAVARSQGSKTDPEPQLVAEAIAAFGENNKRLRELGLPEKDTMPFTGITMKGIAPTFYNITVTKALYDAVKEGKCPKDKTVIQKCTVPRC